MAARIRASLVSCALVKMTDTPVGEYDVLEVSRTLLKECVEVLNASAAGLLLADPSGELQVVASTIEASDLVEVYATAG
ncbi:hypothetical protein [Cryobacterium sp. Y11]|uniref:hypothetical protein n=1 Tax=Cryobacterium sp. Y11 TaxID=2045016 RepID=UPI000CE401CC|nr:hypothetical protein [Cryobacterium sp. Y11]